MSSALGSVLTEIEEHVAADGWDQPPRLFALADTADLVVHEPALAAALGLPGDAVGLTPVEQDPIPEDRPLDETLATIAWPAEVVGAALVLERVVLPPEAEGDVPADGDVRAAVAAHPLRRDVRMAVVVLRDGQRWARLHFRARPQDEGVGEVLTGADLVPGLTDALSATLAD